MARSASPEGRNQETFELDADQEAELLESIAEADRGELIPAEDVLRKLRNRCERLLSS
jgi:predicted transcriptional regulator